MSKRILKTCIKCSDMFQATLTVDGKQKANYSGYVPDFFPEDHYGDYVELEIDIDTGMILNWKRPTQAELKQLDKNT